jgi:uncharacterized protein (TIGR02246 family)
MKRLLFSTLLMISMTPLAPGQGAAQKSATTSARKAIETANKRFVEVFNKGDAVAVAGMYTSDARVLPPNSQTIEGKENIQTFWQEFITMGVKVVKLETVKVEARGDTAYELGQYTLTIPQAGGQTITDQGKYLVVWKRVGRGWKLAVDIWNTSTPTA